MTFFSTNKKQYLYLYFSICLSILIFSSSVFAQSDLHVSNDIERGKYLATISNCQTCHTVEGGKPFAGGVKFVTPFGNIYSTNITQDMESGIGSWSLDDFTAAMREGVRPDGQHLYPVFPYTAYTKMTDEDIASIFNYIKTIDPISSLNKSNDVDFPFNINSLLSVWKMLYLEQGPLLENASQSQAWNRGAYLVEAAGHCSMCHTPRDFLGGEKTDLAYTGGIFTDQVKTGEYRLWSATNLTQADVGLAAWHKQDLIKYLTTGKSNRAITFGPMNAVIMNSTKHLTASDANAMATYVMSLSANSQPAGVKADEDVLTSGQSLYTVHCGTCHLPTGLGSEGKGGDIGEDLGVPLAGSAVVQAANPASMINNILWGSDVPPYPFDSGRREMKAFALKMTDEEIAKLASYVRSAWGNNAGQVSPDEVARQR